MDPLSLAGTIVSLVGFALSSVQTIYTYVDSSVHAPSTARKLAHELQLLSTALEDLEKFLRSEEAQGRTFDKHSMLVTSKNDCEKRLTSLIAKLGPIENDRLTKVLVWPFKEKSIMQEIATFHQYVLVFQLSVTTDGLTLLCQTTSAVEKTLKAQVTALQVVTQGISKIREEASRTREQYTQILDLLTTQRDQADVVARIAHGVNAIVHEKFLNWLSPLNHEARHLEVREQRTKGTGEWVFKSREFRDWYTSPMSSNHSRVSNLWCHGIPGSGKTVIASLIIDFLVIEHEHDRKDSKIVYFYFDHNSQSAQTPQNIARYLLKQLLAQMDSIPSYASKLLNSYRNNIMPPEASEFTKALQAAIKNIPRVFIVFDGLDECDDKPGYRNATLDLLDEFSCSSAKIVVTSRPHASDIRKHLASWAKLEIIAKVDDIRKFLINKLEKHDDPSIFNEDLKTRTVDDIIAISGGMFLLPVLQISRVLEQTRRKDVKKVLDNLSAVPENEYNEAMKRIRQQPGPQAKLAMLILMWLSHTLRLLTMAELQHALAIEIGAHAIDNDEDVTAPEKLVQYCLGLVTIEHDTTDSRLYDINPRENVRIFHLTFQDYLKHHRATLFETDKLTIFQSCLTYLTLDVFATPATSKDDLQHVAAQYPFLGYAAEYWGFHGEEKLDDDVKDQVHRLCQPPYLLFYAQVLSTLDDVSHFDLNEKSNFSLPPISPLHIAAFFGLEWFTREILTRDDTDVNGRTSAGRTALMIAASRGERTLVNLILETGSADVNAIDSPDHRDPHAKTALLLATEFEHNSVVHRLLSHPGIDPNILRPIMEAVTSGKEALVTEFLACENLDLEFQISRMPILMFAIDHAQETTEIVKLLLDNGADPDLPAREVGPLIAAIRTHNKNIVSLFIENEKVDPNPVELTWTPLLQAVHMGNKDILKLLLANEKTDPNLASIKNTALTSALEVGDDEIAKLLSASPRVNPNVPRVYVTTPIGLALANESLEMVYLLIDQVGGALNEPITKAFPPLSLAVQKDRIDVIRAFLARDDVDLDQKDWLGRTAMHIAVQYGRTVAVRMLLDKEKINVNALDEQGLPPGHFARGNAMPVLSAEEAEVYSLNFAKIFKMLLEDSRTDIRLLYHGVSDSSERSSLADGENTTYVAASKSLSNISALSYGNHMSRLHRIPSQPEFSTPSRTFH